MKGKTQKAAKIEKNQKKNRKFENSKIRKFENSKIRKFENSKIGAAILGCVCLYFWTRLLQKSLLQKSRESRKIKKGKFEKKFKEGKLKEEKFKKSESETSETSEAESEAAAETASAMPKANNNAANDAKGAFVMPTPKPAQYTARIARGSEGDVYRAVVKIKKDRMAARREYRIQKNCTHPGVAHVDLSTCATMIFQPAADMDLLTMIHVHKRAIDTRLAWDFIDQIRTALHTIHARGYIHRDLKLENILVYGATVRISDFGFATKIKPGQLLTEKLGSPTYVAPEVMAGVPYDTKADVWSFGVVSFALLTGHKPFASHCYRTIAAPGRDRIRDAASTDGQRALIDTTLRLDPEERASSRAVCNLRIRPAPCQSQPSQPSQSQPSQPSRAEGGAAADPGAAARRSSRLPVGNPA